MFALSTPTRGEAKDGLLAGWCRYVREQSLAAVNDWRGTREIRIRRRAWNPMAVELRVEWGGAVG